MIYFEDDFLPEEQFQALKKKVESKYEPVEARELFDNYDFKNEPDKFILPIARSGDWLDSCIPQAYECVPALEKMEATLKRLGVQELKNWSSWFQYSVDTMSLPVHRDQAVRKSEPKDTLTNFTHNIEPKPNRLTIWSREEWHMVNALTVNDPNYVRSFFGTSWSSIESDKFDKDQNPYERFYFTEIE